MTNDILTADAVASVAANIVGQDMNLAALLYKDLANEFVGGRGSTVRVRVPGAVPSRTRNAFDTTTAMAVDTIAEVGISVTLDTLAYSNVALAPGDLDLALEDHAAQVLRPQASSIAKHIEAATADAMSATAATALTYSAADPAKTFTAIRRTLRSNGVPADARLIAAVGANVYADLLDADAFDENGKVRGFEVHESTRIAADDVIGFIPEAYALVVRAPEVPAGAPYGASVRENGFALTHLRAFDANTAADRSIVEALVAVQPMPLPVDNEDGTVTLLTDGGAVRVNTAA
ncbi:P22 phage major capsid protein family protein [Agromyces sp. SYSU T00266]|uniref:P22 phage major capsid protein family protein n=1 Tax=Agromyces zhanjiangensis TaxID=3158562 RepID=UPI003399DF62